MRNRKNKYAPVLYKSILFVLYFFLLAPQCNSRFYTIANFYLFAPRHTQLSTQPAKAAITTASAHASNSRHLSLDKRFRNTDTYNKDLAGHFANLLVIDPFGCRIKKQFYSFEQAHINALSYATSLRGPPIC